MRDPKTNYIKVDPATLVLFASMLLLLPMLIVGFFTH
jgi:hypothetical protein